MSEILTRDSSGKQAMDYVMVGSGCDCENGSDVDISSRPQDVDTNLEKTKMVHKVNAKEGLSNVLLEVRQSFYSLLDNFTLRYFEELLI